MLVIVISKHSFIQRNDRTKPEKLARMYQFLTKKNIKQNTSFYRNLQFLVNEQNFIGKLKLIFLLKFGLILKKERGRGSVTIIFSNFKIKSLKNMFVIYLQNQKYLTKHKKELIDIMFNCKRISVRFVNFGIYSKEQLSTLAKYIEQLHPEALVLSVICVGKGIDVGCGYRKTHPDAIGVDWVGKGEFGRVGNVKGRVSEADIQAKGDNLKMFKDNSLDYVVARHNLEHYHKPEKTLREWLRVLKIGGNLGIVVPNSANPNTAEKTHFYNFTLENFKEMLLKTQQMRILKIGECIPGWSYYCIAAKIS